MELVSGIGLGTVSINDLQTVLLAVDHSKNTY